MIPFPRHGRKLKGPIFVQVTTIAHEYNDYVKSRRQYVRALFPILWPHIIFVTPSTVSSKSFRRSYTYTI